MGRKVGGSFRRAGTHRWLIYVNLWQKPTQYCNAIILQLKINKFLKKEKKNKKHKKLKVKITVASGTREGGVTGAGIYLQGLQESRQSFISQPSEVCLERICSAIYSIWGVFWIFDSFCNKKILKRKNKVLPHKDKHPFESSDLICLLFSTLWNNDIYKTDAFQTSLGIRMRKKRFVSPGSVWLF